MELIAIDPGPKKSAVCWYKDGKIGARILPNEELRQWLKRARETEAKLAIEMIACYGMTVGHTIFQTCVWIGIFTEAWGKVPQYVFRKDVKMHLCKTMKAKDTHIRKALIARFGSPGTKAKPGVLYGFKADMWAALAVAVYALDTTQLQSERTEALQQQPSHIDA